jgi:uncharacterized protein
MRRANRSAAAAAILAAVLGYASHASAGPAEDEARRQSMMADMRASAAAADRQSFNALQRSRESYDRTYGSAGGSSGVGTGGSSASSSGGARAPSEWKPSGPQSVVATYYFTIHRQESVAAAAVRLEREAAAGDSQSAFDLARIAYTGYGDQPRDEAKARRWFGEAAKAGHPPAQAQFGYMLHDGIGGPADPAAGLTWLRTAADQGETYGQAVYGFYAVKAQAQSPGANLGEAIGYLVRAADNGQMLAQATLGTIVYELGVGAPVDWDKAAHYSRLAADQGWPAAQRELGRMYLTGRGVAKDEAGGVSWLKKAAAGGDAAAMGFLGQLALSGQGMAQDDAAGARWIKQAADHGDAGAATNFAVLLANGRGVAKDERESVRYAQLAADAGDANGQVVLAKAYYFGQGAPKDMSQSLAWFRKAAAQGQPEAVEALKDDALVAAASGN